MEKVYFHSNIDKLKIIDYFRAGNKYILSSIGIEGSVTYRAYLMEIISIDEKNNEVKLIEYGLEGFEDPQSKDVKYATNIDYWSTEWNYYLLNKEETEEYYKKLIVGRLY